MHRIFFIIWIGLLFVAAPVAAQDLKKGLLAYKKGDYETALREWRPLAEAGHSGAQYNLGFNYVQGKGVPKDLVQAYFWFDLAARQDKPIAKQLRDGVAKKMTKEQLAEARMRVKAWMDARPRLESR